MSVLPSAADIEASSLAVTLADQIRCARREIALRRNVYTRRVRSRLMNAEEAQRELAAMMAILHTLLDVDTGELEIIRQENARLQVRVRELEADTGSVPFFP